MKRGRGSERGEEVGELYSEIELFWGGHAFFLGKNFQGKDAAIDESALQELDMKNLAMMSQNRWVSFLLSLPLVFLDPCFCCFSSLNVLDASTRVVLRMVPCFLEPFLLLNPLICIFAFLKYRYFSSGKRGESWKNNLVEQEVMMTHRKKALEEEVVGEEARRRKSDDSELQYIDG